MTLQFSKMKSSSNYFDVDVFLLSSLVTDPSFMPVSWLVLELWHFLFIKDWPEIRKSKITLPEFCSISRVLVIPNLAQMNTAKSRCYSFYRFWPIKGKPTGIGKITPNPQPQPQHQIRVNLSKFSAKYSFLTSSS